MLNLANLTPDFFLYSFTAMYETWGRIRELNPSKCGDNGMDAFKAFKFLQFETFTL